jgi:hypothetical protein
LLLFSHPEPPLQQYNSEKTPPSLRREYIYLKHKMTAKTVLHLPVCDGRSAHDGDFSNATEASVREPAVNETNPTSCK